MNSGCFGKEIKDILISVQVLDKTGKLLEEIPLHGKKPTNITFPKGTNKEVYVTIQDKKWIEKITF